jgi:hypothetical protein
MKREDKNNSFLRKAKRQKCNIFDTVFLTAHLLRQKQKELKRLENLSVLDFDKEFKEFTLSLQDLYFSSNNSMETSQWEGRHFK